MRVIWEILRRISRLSCQQYIPTMCFNREQSSFYKKIQESIKKRIVKIYFKLIYVKLYYYLTNKVKYNDKEQYMYNFKHKINEYQRFNTYELYIQDNKRQINSYEKIRNGLFFVVLILTAFIIGAFSHKSYQNHQKKPHPQEIEIKEMKTLAMSSSEKLAHVKLTKAITNSVVNNLQANSNVKTMNYNELKLIIKKVVSKIQEKPNRTEAI